MRRSVLIQLVLNQLGSNRLIGCVSVDLQVDRVEQCVEAATGWMSSSQSAIQVGTLCFSTSSPTPLSTPLQAILQYLSCCVELRGILFEFQEVALQHVTVRACRCRFVCPCLRRSSNKMSRVRCHVSVSGLGFKSSTAFL